MPTDAYVTKVYQKGLHAHSFKTHFPSSFDSYSINQQYMCVIQLKVKQFAFTQSSFPILSDVHECSGGLPLTSSQPVLQPAVIHYTTG